MNLTDIFKQQLNDIGIDRPNIMIAKGRRYIQKRLPRRYPRYGEMEFRSALDRVGVSSGATVFVHSAWDEFYNFDGTPVDLLRALQKHVGPEGTVALPAYPRLPQNIRLFDVRGTPTDAGLLPEIFRRMPGVRRSINLFHSVAAMGRQADYLVRDHHRSETPWDRWSPYARLADVNAIITWLGLPKSFALTAQHCAESLLYHEIPYFRLVFGEPVTYRYRNEHGEEGLHSIRPRIGQWRASRTRRYLDQSQIRATQVSNLRVHAIDAQYLISRMVELARQGITNYYWPKPKARLFTVDPRG